MIPSVQSRIQHLLDEFTQSGIERGIQVTAYQNGRVVADACSGVASVETGQPVNAATLFPVFSVTKGIAATMVHRLVERGLLADEQPIAEIWPEFAANGKARITLRQGLNHSCGVPHMPPAIDFADLADWSRICSAVAQLTPIWPPGSRAEYHAITYGWIVGEPACRAAGRSFEQLLEDEIRVPLGIDDLYVGIPDEVESRVAWLEEANPAPPPADPSQPSSVPGWLGPLHAFMNRPDMRRACLPASSGIMSARAIARHYAALLPGRVDGIELLSPDRVRAARTPQGLSAPDGEPAIWPALGYQLQEAYSVPGSPDKAFGHGGYGGSMGLADPERGIAFGLTKNRLHAEGTALRVYQELLAALADASHEQNLPG